MPWRGVDRPPVRPLLTRTTGDGQDHHTTAPAPSSWVNRHPWLAGAAGLARQILHDARDDRVTGLAAELGFFALLGIFPGLLAVAASLGALDSLVGSDVAARAQEQVTGVLRTFLTDQAAGTIEAIRSLFRGGRTGVFTFGVLGALWAASRGMATVLGALSEIYDHAEDRSRLRRRAVALGLAVASVVLIAVTLGMVVLGPLFGAGEALAQVVGLDEAYTQVWALAGLPVAFVALVGWAAVVFHSVPHPHGGWWPHLAGALLAGGLWLAVSVGLRVYLHLFGGNPVFGLLGGALVILLWLYLLSLGLLIGAELNAVLGCRRAAPASPSTGSDRLSEPAPGEG